MDDIHADEYDREVSIPEAFLQGDGAWLVQTLAGLRGRGWKDDAISALLGADIALWQLEQRIKDKPDQVLEVLEDLRMKKQHALWAFSEKWPGR